MASHHDTQILFIFIILLKTSYFSKDAKQASRIRDVSLKKFFKEASRIRDASLKKFFKESSRIRDGFLKKFFKESSRIRDGCLKKFFKESSRIRDGSLEKFFKGASSFRDVSSKIDGQAINNDQKSVFASMASHHDTQILFIFIILLKNFVFFNRFFYKFETFSLLGLKKIFLNSRPLHYQVSRGNMLSIELRLKPEDNLCTRTLSLA